MKRSDQEFLGGVKDIVRKDDYSSCLDIFQGRNSKCYKKKNEKKKKKQGNSKCVEAKGEERGPEI